MLCEQLFQGNPAEKVAKAVQAPEVKKPGEPIKLPSFGLDAGTIALPGELTMSSNALVVLCFRALNAVVSNLTSQACTAW